MLDEVQAQAIRVVRSHGMDSLVKQVEELGAMLDLLASNVSLQKDNIRYVQSAAEDSLENVRAGNEQLVEATNSPSSMRDAALVLLLSLWAIIVFLDWFNP